MPRAGNQARSAYLQFSQVWFPTVQDVLQADWQDVWHSPHPPFLIVFCNFLVFNVFTCFIRISPLSVFGNFPSIFAIIAQHRGYANLFLYIWCRFPMFVTYSVCVLIFWYESSLQFHLRDTWKEQPHPQSSIPPLPAPKNYTDTTIQKSSSPAKPPITEAWIVSIPAEVFPQTDMAKYKSS